MIGGSGINVKNKFIIKAWDIFKISSQRKEYKRKRNREKKKENLTMAQISTERTVSETLVPFTT